jgi:uncharacterized protein YdeI (YjbR/CyaY-like superfamily)
MGTRDKRVDDYIEKSGDFAKPILAHLREIVHEGCPEVQEEMKWSFPNFVYKGILCNMAAFKEHCSFGFWKAKLMFGEREREAMGNFGRLTSVKDLPSKKSLVGYVKEAKRLNDEGVKIEKPKASKEKKDLVVPPYLLAALKKNNKASAAWDGFSYSHKKEYVEWVTEAKTEETRQRRLATTLEWLAEGKSRNWKYERC